MPCTENILSLLARKKIHADPRWVAGLGNDIAVSQIGRAQICSGKLLTSQI
jgi:hypothetical protein